MNKKKEPVKEEDLIKDAFIALGGSHSTSGMIDIQNLVKLIQKDFGLEINIEKLLDDNKSGNQTFLNFESFKALMFK